MSSRVRAVGRGACDREWGVGFDLSRFPTPNRTLHGVVDVEDHAFRAVFAVHLLVLAFDDTTLLQGQVDGAIEPFMRFAGLSNQL